VWRPVGSDGGQPRNAGGVEARTRLVLVHRGQAYESRPCALHRQAGFPAAPATH
jgi:hypothetical protein